MKGIITDIQRFSLKDGPGIRTTVFFKGCNMACKWCHNPETLSIAPQLLCYPQKCIKCGSCVMMCPTGSRFLDEKGMLVYNRGKCIHCGTCANNCFSGALILSGRWMDVDEVMAEVIQDADYYRNSGGGVTLSGGEVTMQYEFAGELLAALKAKGISTAVETNMLANWSRYEELIPCLDMVMMDIKLFSEEKHRKWTGVGNQNILENIRKMSDTGIPIIVRTPVIPGVNDDEGEIGRIADFIASLRHVEYYELLQFNPLGESKYNALGLENEFAGVRPLDAEHMEPLAKAAERSRVPVRII